MKWFFLAWFGFCRLEIWPGYVTSVNEVEGGLILQCDISHRILRTTTVRAAMVDINTMNRVQQERGDPTREPFQAQIKKALLGQVVLTRYNNKTYRIDEVDFNRSPEDTFENSRGETLTFLDYYQTQYGIQIKDTKQPLILNRCVRKNPGEEKIIY